MQVTRIQVPERVPDTQDQPRTGAVKHDQGKTSVWRGFMMYFPRAAKAIADVSDFGYQKYKAWDGWRNVPDGISRYSDALGRHILGENIEGMYDPESGILHAAHAAWNACARLEKMIENGIPLRNPMKEANNAKSEGTAGTTEPLSDSRNKLETLTGITRTPGYSEPFFGHGVRGQ